MWRATERWSRVWRVMERWSRVWRAIGEVVWGLETALLQNRRMLHRNQLEERTHRGAEDGTSLSQAKNMVKSGLSTHTETRGPQVD